MKKLILSFLSCLILFSAYATDYTGDLKITFPGVYAVLNKTETDRVVSVELTDATNGLYTLSISDFTFTVFGKEVNLGTIELKDIKGEKQSDGTTVLATSNEGYKLYMAALQAEVTINFKGVISKDEKTFTIDNMTIADAPMVDTVTCTFEGTAPASTAIQSIVADTNDYQIYNLTGRRVDNMNESGIYIIRYSNGVTKKIIKK